MKLLPASSLTKILTLSLGLASFSQPAFADNAWDGGGSSPFNWSDNTNWGSDTAPSYGTLVFNGANGTTNTIDTNFSMNQVNWNGSSAWVLNNSGGAVLSLFDNGGTQAKLESLGSGGVTINAPVTFAATTGSNWGEINSVSSSITFGIGSTLTVNGAAVNGIRMFGGGAGISTNFDGTVNATGKYFATNSVGQTINVGGSFTSGDFYLMNSGTLNLNSGGTLSATAIRLGGDFGTTGSQDLSKGATFALTAASGGQSFGGSINPVTSNTSSALVVDSQNTSGTNTLSGSIFLDSALRFQQAGGGTLLVSGTIQNTGGGLTKAGSGAMILTTANTYTGATTISSGTLQIGNSGTTGALSTSSAISITNNGALVFNRSDSITQGTNFSTAAITGSGSLTQAGSGLLVLNASNTYSGGTIVNSGTLRLTQSTSAAATGTFSLGGGAFQLSQGGNNFGYGAAINLTADSSFSNVGAGAINHTGPIFGNNHALTINNTGNRMYINGTVSGITQFNVTAGAMGFDLGGGNSGGGAPVIVSNGASLWVVNATVTGSNNITLNGGTGSGGTGALYQEGSANVSTLSGTVTLNSGTSSIGVGNAAGTISLTGKVTGTGSLAKIGVGTLRLSGSNDYSGATTISAGTLQLGNGGTTGVLSGSSAITNNGTFTINRSNAVVQGADFSPNAITGSGAFVQAGSGITTLNTANTFTGSTTLTSGTLSVADASYLGGTTANNTIVFNGGTLQVTGTNMTSFGSHAVTYNASKVIGFDIADATNNFTTGTTAFLASDTLTKLGAGTLTLGATTNALTTLNINANSTLDIGSGSLTINGGGGNAIQSTTGGIITGGTIFLGGISGDYGTASNTTLTINSKISSSGTGRIFEYWNGNVANTGTIILTNTNNDFAGGVLIGTAGTISVDLVGNAGSVGPLSTGTVTLAQNGATLKYTGTGESSNRLITMGGGANTGGTIDASGTGTALQLSNVTNTNTANGTATLTLTGGGLGEITGVLANQNGSRLTAVTKTGTGTWTLSGSNTYTGATTISGGTLKNGSATAFSGSSGALSMSSTGIFDLGGFNATVGNISAMTSGNTITNSGSSDATLSVTGQGSISLAGLFTDGATNKLAISLANANATTQFTNSGNTFSGGLNLLNSGTGTRLYINSAIGFAGTPGALTSSNFGTGTITIGQTGTDKAGIRFDTAASGTMANAIVFNTALGTDVVGISSSVTAGVTLAGAITANSNAAFNTTASTANMTVSGAISGAGGVVSSGAGKVTLSGSNSYLGATTISAGTLQFAKTNSMSASSAVTTGSGATLAVNAGGAGEFTGGTGNGTIGGLFTGLGGQAGSTVSYTSGAFLGVDTTNASSTVTESTNFSAAGVGLTKLGAGTLALTGSNTYSGATTISAGTLEYQAASAMSGSSAVTIASGGTLSLRADANTTFMPSSVTGASGTSNITVNQLTGSGTGKTLTLANTYFAGASGSSLTVSGTSGDTLLLSSQFALFNASAPTTTINLSGADLTLNAGVTFNGATNGPLLTVNAGSNTLLINGNWTTGGNRWSGIQINNGTVTMANGQNGGSSINFGVYAVLTGGTLNLNSNTAIGGANAGNNFTISGGTLDNTSGSSKTLGAPNVTINGNFAFSTAAGGTNNNLSLGTGAVGLGNTGGPRTITTNGSATLTFGGAVSGSNGLTKAGTGTLALSASNSYTGATTISDGTLRVTGHLANTASVSVSAGATLNVNGQVNAAATTTVAGLLSGTGSLGTVSVSGTVAAGNSAGTLSTAALTLQSTAAVNFELQNGDVTIGNNINDLIAVTGDLTLDGTLNVTELGGTLANNTYRLFNYSGSLTNNTLDISSAFLAMHPGSTIDTATFGQINLLVVPEPGAGLMLLSGVAMFGLLRRRRA